jgi:hypothetical protein
MAAVESNSDGCEAVVATGQDEMPLTSEVYSFTSSEPREASATDPTSRKGDCRLVHAD